MSCSLVPKPVSYVEGEGFCDISAGALIVAPQEWSDEASVLSSWLTAALKADFPLSLAVDESGWPLPEKPRIVLEMSARVKKEEEYALSIRKDGIHLTASMAGGAVRAASTLAQLAITGKGRIASAQIEDYPRFAWRGLMLDSARSFFSVGFIEKMIDVAALHKLNTFHWHLTDDQAWRLELNFAPEVAAHGSRRLDRRYNVPRWREGCYSQAEVRQVVEFARVRHVQVVPEIEVPGHVTALLASHPEFSCAGAADPGRRFEPEDRFGIFDDILCAGTENVLKFLESVLDEICALFPGLYVHMGGDEAPKIRWKECPRCRARMKELFSESDPEGLQAWFMGKIAEMLAKKGRRMVGWDEVVDGKIRHDVVVAAWRSIDRVREVAKANYQVVACPQSRACYLDHKQVDDPEEPGHLGICRLEDSYGFDPAAADLSTEEEGRILGGQANLWSELLYSTSLAEFMLFPRLCALSEVFWTPRNARNYPDFLTRMISHGQRLDSWNLNRHR